MRRILISLAIAQALCIANVYAADKGGTFVPKDRLPAGVAASKASKAPKYPGIPACSKGRERGDWGLVPQADFDAMKAAGHKCIASDVIFVCTAFGKLSVRCE